jgi:hypothetical protein
LTLDYYCDLGEFIFSRTDKKTYLNELSFNYSPISELYKGSYPTQENGSILWNHFESVFFEEKNIDFQDRSNSKKTLKHIEARAIVNWVYQAYKTIDERKLVTKKFISTIQNLYNVSNLSFSESIIYDNSRCTINIIKSFRDFLEKIDNNEMPGYKYFYRGHSDSSYILLPAIMRNKNWIEHECNLYNELLIECPSDFNHCSSNLEYLVHMQHYGLPTRLLDVTKNPLVALYFACKSNPNESGEIIVFSVPMSSIKYPGSDSISILSALPKISTQYKKDLMIWAKDPELDTAGFNLNAIKLLQEIRMEKPAFIGNISKSDLLECYFVLSTKKNNRIIKQDGAFIICGLFDSENNPINNFRLVENGLIKVFIIDSKSKKNIESQLEKFSINSASLFPEIVDVADYIKSKYVNK